VDLATPFTPPRVRNLFGPLPIVRPQPIGVTDECAVTWVAARFRCPREGAIRPSAERARLLALAIVRETDN
jgi:hypothetical protein